MKRSSMYVHRVGVCCLIPVFVVLYFVPVASAHVSTVTTPTSQRRVQTQAITFDLSKAQWRSTKDLPANGFCFGTGCDGRVYNGGSQPCTDFQSTFVQQSLYVAGHYVGRLVIVKASRTGGATPCDSAWGGIQIASGVCTWNDNWAMGVNNTKEVIGSYPATPNQVCNGGWSDSLMDEDELLNGNPCESAWSGGTTAYNGQTNWYVKIIGGPSGC